MFILVNHQFEWQPWAILRTSKGLT